MRTFQEIKANYRFSEPEMETLKSLLPVVEPHADRIVSDFYTLMLGIPDTAKFLKDEAKLTWLRAEHRSGCWPCFRAPMTRSTANACSASATPTCASIFRPTSFTWA